MPDRLTWRWHRSVDDHDPRTVSVWLSVQGRGSVSELAADLAELDGMLAVAGDDANTPLP